MKTKRRVEITAFRGHRTIVATGEGAETDAQAGDDGFRPKVTDVSPMQESADGSCVTFEIAATPELQQLIDKVWEAICERSTEQAKTTRRVGNRRTKRRWIFGDSGND
ncbi:MAG TPA: hypothetical protein VGQ39_10100 [Pyrinomonadaceae bacterium]|nr:hypothetical protein [Pyrinomonadaceae bacterium]